MSAGRLDIPTDRGSLAAFRLSGGDQGAPVVLAIHGITASSRAWVAVARELGDDAALVAVDLRGRGRSSDLPGPYGIGAHVQDMVAVLDHLGPNRPVVMGHSLGAYIAARLATEHPDRVGAAVLVDGGLKIPGTEGGDPQELLDAFLGPAIARLGMRFASRQEYRAWWRLHPALASSDVRDADLAAYADHDLTGSEPELHSVVSEEAVRADAADLFRTEEHARRLIVPAALLCAPRGLMDDPHPMQPFSLVRDWAAERPGLRRAVEVADVNHYTIVLGGAGARAVAGAVREALAAR